MQHRRKLSSKEAAVLASEILNANLGEEFLQMLQHLAALPADSGINLLANPAAMDAYLKWREGRIDLVKELMRMAEHGRRIKLARDTGAPEPTEAELFRGFDGDGDPTGWEF